MRDMPRKASSAAQQPGTALRRAFVRFFSLWINTMKRWILALAAAMLATVALSQEVVVRTPPPDVRPARLQVNTAPQITLDGKPDRLSPGARIRDTRNLMVLSGSLAGQTLPVLYRREFGGQVHDVWVLTPEEYARVAGVSADLDSLDGHKRFAELLELLWKARSALLLR